MIVYYRIMRVKDENKKDAILAATVRLINEIGFVNVSMSKIARAAGVSASTLYIYYENKEDMFRKVYLDVKKQMIRAGARGLDREEPVKHSVERFCENLLQFMEEHEDYFLFIEQSSNSPLINTAVNEEIEQLNQEIYAVFDKGIREGILKDTKAALLVGFCFYPITQLYKVTCQPDSWLQELDHQLLIQMCWDAIKN